MSDTQRTQPNANAELQAACQMLLLIQTECLEAWQSSTKSVKELAFLKQVHNSLSLRVQLLGLKTATRKKESAAPAPAPAPEPQTSRIVMKPLSSYPPTEVTWHIKPGHFPKPEDTLPDTTTPPEAFVPDFIPFGTQTELDPYTESPEDAVLQNPEPVLPAAEPVIFCKGVRLPKLCCVPPSLHSMLQNHIVWKHRIQPFVVNRKMWEAHLEAYNLSHEEVEDAWRHQYK